MIFFVFGEQENIANLLPRTYYREYRDSIRSDSATTVELHASRACPSGTIGFHTSTTISYNIKQSSVKSGEDAMADDDEIEDMDLDDDYDEQDDIEYEDSAPADLQPKNARRELEKRLEMKRLREMLDYDEFEDDF